MTTTTTANQAKTISQQELDQIILVNLAHLTDEQELKAIKVWEQIEDYNEGTGSTFAAMVLGSSGCGLHQAGKAAVSSLMYFA